MTTPVEFFGWVDIAVGSAATIAGAISVLMIKIWLGDRKRVTQVEVKLDDHIKTSDERYGEVKTEINELETKVDVMDDKLTSSINEVGKNVAELTGAVKEMNQNNRDDHERIYKKLDK